MYVVNAPDLVVAVQRNTKTILFNPFVVAMTPRLFGTGPRTNAIVAKEATKEKGAFMADIHDGMYEILGPGRELERMTQVTLETLNSYFNELSSDKDAQVDLFGWIRRVFTISSTDAVYGLDNPFRLHSELEDAFWEFEKQMTSLLIGVFPSITARKGIQAREKITNAMEAYLLKRGGDGGGGLLKVRYDINMRYGVPVRDFACFEIGDCIGVLINATPTFFWLLFDIYSRPTLLEALREELESSGTIVYSQKSSTMTLHVPSLKTTCPLLFSTFQEVLRVRTRNATTRWITEDTYITGSSNNNYLLKKDSVVQMPAVPMHYNTILWGPDAHEFNPARFIKGSSSLLSSTSASSSVGSKDDASPLFSGYDPSKGTMNARPAQMRQFKKGSFRAFGGGATLCPGRHFATNELISATAIFIERFDIQLPERGRWVEPKCEGNRLASSIPPPSGDLKVNVKGRDGFEGWVMKLDFGSEKNDEAEGFELAI